MKHSLKIECIGDNMHQKYKEYKKFISEIFNYKVSDIIFGEIPSRFFVAEIIGFDSKFKYRRKFLSFKKDFKDSNSVGSRGVFAYYILEENKIYDIKNPISWSKNDRYFCYINKMGDIIKLTEEQVIKWLKNR